MLTGHKLVRSYEGRRILDEVDVEIAPGQITTLIGPSGSGKTTLLRALSLIDPPDSGVVGWDETSLSFPFPKDAPLAPPWPYVTVVFQQLFLWPHLTLRENILLPARNVWEDQDALVVELENLGRSLDMAAYLDRFPNQASLGQRQRVALARAILLKPRYILMDEVTSALDVEQVHKILTYLPTLRERGIGVLLITHLLHFATHASDHILFLDGGRIQESGPPSILLEPQSPRLRQFLSIVEQVS
ncbi:MAG: amino acid ABC transporter ATP-binding protein [Alphaproteobacteria bacterium]|nr:MAG: amino acid ABC transporter ATP-binding protein [Alphaproteobacteria bacterium]